VRPDWTSAAGFALIEQNASGLGNAYAGGAAIAEDASTIFFNPAGLSRISGKQLAVSGEAIGLSVKFQNQGSTAGVAHPVTGGNGGEREDGLSCLIFIFANGYRAAVEIRCGSQRAVRPEDRYDAGWQDGTRRSRQNWKGQHQPFSRLSG